MSQVLVHVMTSLGRVEATLRELQTQGGPERHQEMLRGKAAGAKAWLVKPFQPPTLLNAVSKLVIP